MDFTEQLPKELLDKINQYTESHQPEVDWHYDSELSNEQIEKLVSGTPETLGEIEFELEEYNLDYISDLRDEAVKQVYQEFKDDIKAILGPKKGWKKEFKEYVRDMVYVDMNMDQLMRNSGQQVFFYDTGLEFTGWPNTEAEYRLDRIRIKKCLGIKDSKYDKIIMEVLLNASYGGRLVVYFTSYLKEMLDILYEAKANTITFKNPHIAIADTSNGSGHDTYLAGHSFSLSYAKENMFYERAVHYNYTYEVCGMDSSWCEGTDFALSTTEQSEPAVISSLNNHMSQQSEYEKTYKAGKCTYGDMDMKRHRHITYSNNFPCGNTCQDCGTFWID